MHKFIKYIIEKNGIPYQLTKALEELAELQKELAKYILEPDRTRRENIAEETADVQLMIEQIRTIFDIDDLEMAQRIKSKIERYTEGENKKGK